MQTQEILVRIVTRLAQFDFRSKLKTWAYRIAANYILDLRKNAVERLHLSFERMGDDLTSGPSSEACPETEQSLLIEEVKIGCSLAMLQCLDRPHRLAYVLGQILELPGASGRRSPGDFTEPVPKAPPARTRDHCRVYTEVLRLGLRHRRLPLQSSGTRGVAGR